LRMATKAWRSGSAETAKLTRSILSIVSLGNAGCPLKRAARLDGVWSLTLLFHLVS
jgi:hypothetical protein